MSRWNNRTAACDAHRAQVEAAQDRLSPQIGIVAVKVLHAPHTFIMNAHLIEFVLVELEDIRQANRFLDSLLVGERRSADSNRRWCFDRSTRRSHEAMQRLPGRMSALRQCAKANSAGRTDERIELLAAPKSRRLRRRSDSSVALRRRRRRLQCRCRASGRSECTHRRDQGGGHFVARNSRPRSSFPTRLTMMAGWPSC